MRELLIILEGKHLATLYQNSQGAVRLDYEPDLEITPETTPLSLSMPLAGKSYQNRICSNWMANLLPDDAQVLKRWAHDFKVSASSPFRLLEHVGRDIAGAARLLPPGVNPHEGGIDWWTIEEVEKRLSELTSDPTAWTQRHARGQFSLAGAQPKTALRWDGDRWGKPYGSEPTTHILKLSSMFPYQNLNEHLTLATAARLRNFSVVSTELRKFDGGTAIVVERYDRRIENGEVARLHQEDMCQALKFAPSYKYQQDGGPGIKDICGLLRSHVLPEAVENEIKKFIRAIAFSWVVASTDGHAKNYSLLLSGPRVQLAPLYDVQSSLPYLSRSEREISDGAIGLRTAEFAMKIGNHYHINSITKQDWEKVADECGVERADLLAMVHEIAVQTPQEFDRVVAEELSNNLLNEKEVEFVSRFRELINDRSRECLEVLDQ